MTVRPAVLADADALAAQLRAADRREIAALGQTPQAALREGVSISDQVYTVRTRSGELAAIFGVAPHPGEARVGAPWMMGSDALATVAIPFLRRSAAWVDALGAGRDLLINAVDARNQLHIRWLGWAGFTFVGRRPRGPERRPFLDFAKLVASPRAAPGVQPSEKWRRPCAPAQP